MEVYAQQNDNLDAILYRYFGRSEGLLEIACELNPHLMDKPVIPIGTPVILPETDTEKISVASDTIQLGADMHDTPSRASYISGLFAFFIGRIADMFSNVNWADVASATGIVIGVATFLVNWYYKKKDFD